MRWLKDILAEKKEAYGIWLASGSPVAAEIAGIAGFDWALIDMEHGIGDVGAMFAMLQAIDGSSTAPVVRVPPGAAGLVQKALDYGACGVMAPMIDTADAARTLARAVRYPPAGTRGLTSSSRATGYGRDAREYFAGADQKVAAIVQVETAAAVDNADSIAAVEGIDVLFVGHSDLGLALGRPGDYACDAIRRAEDKVLAACDRHGKRAGMLLKAGMPAAPYRERGFSVIALGSDIGCLRQGYGRLLSEARQT